MQKCYFIVENLISFQNPHKYRCLFWKPVSKDGHQWKYLPVFMPLYGPLPWIPGPMTGFLVNKMSWKGHCLTSKAGSEEVLLLLPEFLAFWLFFPLFGNPAAVLCGGQVTWRGHVWTLLGQQLASTSMGVGQIGHPAQWSLKVEVIATAWHPWMRTAQLSLIQHANHVR